MRGVHTKLHSAYLGQGATNSLLQRPYVLTCMSLPLSLPRSDSSAISWSDDDSACDFTDRFEKCGRGRRKRVEESAADAEEKASTEDEDEAEHGDEDRTASSAAKKSEKNKERQTSHHAKVEAAPAPVKVGDTLWCLEARPMGL